MPDPLEVAPLRLASPDERKVGKKHTRHASDKNTPPDETQPGDQSANPVGVGAAQMGDFGVDSCPSRHVAGKRRSFVEVDS